MAGITVNVLMCGGRRAGKTSILAAMDKNMQDMFSDGSITALMSGAGELSLYRKKQSSLFSEDYNSRNSYEADDSPTEVDVTYTCSVNVQNLLSGVTLNFTDVPGEWFVNKEFHDDIIKYIRQSQILIIAVDSPHLVEKDGRYHDAFNRPEQIAEMVSTAFQGTEEARLILFVPVKCERYRDKVIKDYDMEFLLESVKNGYKELLDYLMNETNKKRYAVAVAPCITMGGMQFLQFVPPLDADGKPEKDELGKPHPDLELNINTGYYDMAWHTEYMYLRDVNNDHYYEPEDCEQPLLYVLLFLISFGQISDEHKGGLGKILSSFLGSLNKLLHPIKHHKDIEKKLRALEKHQSKLRDALKRGREQGFEILNDPYKMF